MLGIPIAQLEMSDDVTKIPLNAESLLSQKELLKS